jgi:hypothetical protein
MSMQDLAVQYFDVLEHWKLTKLYSCKAEISLGLDKEVICTLPLLI